MSKKVLILLFFTGFICAFYYQITAESYNLASQDAFLTYLPSRLRTLISYAKQNGVTNSVKFVQEDRDLNSYLFILDVKEPHKFLAYSRTKQLVNKTTAQLQNVLIDQPDTDDTSLIFKRIISTAQKGDTFLAYQFRFDPNNPLKYQVAYVHWFSSHGKNYVLGAALFVETVPDYFIIMHRVKTVAKRIKKEGIEQVAPLLAHDPEPDNYFFIVQRKYPYRQIVNGANDKFLRKSAQELQQIVFPHCEDPTICDFSIWYERVDKIILPGAGFYAYLWPTATARSLKVGYMCPLEQEKHQYFLASGIRLRNVPTNLYKILPQRVNRYLELIKSVGLENAVTVGHTENTPDAYVYIIELAPPYKHILFLNRKLEGEPLDIAYAEWKISHEKRSYIDYTTIMNQEFAIARAGGGFYVYPYHTEGENPQTFLKISFLKPFTYEGKNYYVGSGYLIK